MVRVRTSRGEKIYAAKMPREVKRILAYLDTLEDDEVIETDALMLELGYTRLHHPTHVLLDRHRFKPHSSGFVIWGKPVALKAYQEEINE